MEVEDKDTQLRERNAQLQRQEAELQEKATLLSRLQRELQTLRVGDLFIGRCKGVKLVVISSGIASKLNLKLSSLCMRLAESKPTHLTREATHNTFL